MLSKQDLKLRFENGDIPKQEEFWEWQDSYWHKDEKLPADKIDYDFSEKADLVDGKIPASQLPSYVDDILEFNSFSSLPSEGEKGKIYVLTDTNNQYRWSGSEYIQINFDANIMTINTNQSINGRKEFITDGGNTWDRNNLMTIGKNGNKAGLTFYSEGMDVGQLQYDGNFHFIHGNNANYQYVKSYGYRKMNSSDDYLLTGGGGHLPKSDFEISELGSVNLLPNSETLHLSTSDYSNSDNSKPGEITVLSALSWNAYKFINNKEYTLGNNLTAQIEVYHEDVNERNFTFYFYSYGNSKVSYNHIVKPNIWTKLVSTALPTATDTTVLIGIASNDMTAGTKVKYRNIQLEEGSIPSTYTPSIEELKGLDYSTGINNGSDTRTNKTWFDYNWANTGGAGSVINFSGLNGAYSTELFSDYKTGTVIGMRTRNGDAGIWNSPKILWHDHNFNPNDKISYTGADKPINLNGQNLSNITRLLTNGSIKHNGLGLSLVNASGSGGYNSIVVKTGFTTGNMGTFTVKIYNYAHEYFEFNVNNYKYNNSNYATNITWKAGNSKRIEKIEFLKDSSDNLYINIVSYLAYPRIAITDLMVYGWEDAPFDNSNWSIELGGSTSALIFEGQAIPKDFLRDEGLDTSFWKIYDDGNSKGLLADKPFSFLTIGGVTAQKILTGGLLTSDYYGDNVNVPANGIFSKGDIKTTGQFIGDRLSSANILGNQIINAYGNTLTLGNPALPKLNIETADANLTHYRAGYGNGVIWDEHNLNPANFVKTSQLSNYVTLDTPQGIDSEKTFNTYFSSYTSDGLFDSNADSNLKTNTPSGRKVIFGYRDYGAGQYYPRIGFTANTNWSLGAIDDYFTIGINNDGTETLKITSKEAYINGHRIWNEGNFTSIDTINWNQAFNWGNHSTAGYTTQTWINSQDYATSSLVEESIDKLTIEITNPDTSINAENKFVTILITDNIQSEQVEWKAFHPEQYISVINIGSKDINLNLQGKTFDRIRPRETSEYYVNKKGELIKKGNYKETTILIH